MTRRVLLALGGLAMGLTAGLGYAWGLSPVKDTAPASLQRTYKDQYIQLVAQAFAVEGDVERARARLEALGEVDPARAVTAFAQRAAASGSDAESVRSLAALASALGARPATATPAPASATPPPGETAIALEPSATAFVPAAAPTRTPTPAPLGVFEFVGKELVCAAGAGRPLIQALMLDAGGGQVPGVEVIVEWDGGFDHFFTGLKPELGQGYGDFEMTEGVEYAVHLVASPSASVTGIFTEPCTDGAGRSFPGSWRLVFREQ
jgi:hypothetical protein